MTADESEDGRGRDLAGATCPGCDEPIRAGQSVVRLTAGLLMPGTHLAELAMRPHVYVHAGAGYDASHDVVDRWCMTPEALERALELMLVSDATSASGH
jgi:hypothetical protein